LFVVSCVFEKVETQGGGLVEFGLVWFSLVE